MKTPDLFLDEIRSLTAELQGYGSSSERKLLNELLSVLVEQRVVALVHATPNNLAAKQAEINVLEGLRTSIKPKGIPLTNF